MLLNIANLLYLASCFVKDILWLRVFSVIATSCLVPYYYIREEPLLTALYWNLFFVVLNLWRIVVLLRNRARERDQSKSNKMKRKKASRPTVNPVQMIRGLEPLRALAKMSLKVVIVSGLLIGLSTSAVPAWNEETINELLKIPTLARDLSWNSEETFGRGAKRHSPRNIGVLVNTPRFPARPETLENSPLRASSIFLRCPFFRLESGSSPRTHQKRA